MKKYYFSIILMGLVSLIQAEVPYESYLYNRWKETVPVPHAYVPDGVLFGEDLNTTPLKDPQGINEGLIELSGDGTFKQFFGAVKVSVTFADFFWKIFSTDEQRSRMKQAVPTVYNNVLMDPEGFLMVTSSALKEYQILNAINYGGDNRERVTPVRRLNPKGEDILKRFDWFPAVGDISFLSSNSSIIGPSSFVDVASTETGIFFVLDQKRGRVFSYDPEGIMLSIFGGLGSREGLLKNPVGLEITADGSVLVLDGGRNCINRYIITDYGQHVQDGIIGYYKGRYDKSQAAWEAALSENANLEWAYWGIGNALYRKHQYKEAMEYFQIIRFKGSFSRAFRFYRKEIMSQYFGWIVAGVALIIIGINILIRILRKKGATRVK